MSRGQDIVEAARRSTPSNQRRYSDPKLQRRSMDIRALHLDDEDDEDNKRFTFRLTSDKPIDMPFIGREILSHEEGAIRLDRLNEGRSALLRNHDANQIIGAVRSAKIVDGEVEVQAEFIDTQAGREAHIEFRAGALRGASAGYRVHTHLVIKEGGEFEGMRGPLVVATDWEIFEATLTPIPADPTVGA